MAFNKLEDWYFDMAVSFKNHGIENFMGVASKYDLERAKKKYEDELRYHNLNPSNRSSALDVERAKKNVDDLQKRFDVYGKNTYLLDMIKKVSAQSEEGGLLISGGFVAAAWEMCSNLREFKDFFEASNLNIISCQSECGENEYISDEEKRIATIRILDGNDIYEATWAGHCRKLRDDEMKVFRAEKRNKERVAAEIAEIRAREQAEKTAMDNSCINQHGHWLGWAIMIGFMIWIIGGVISNMP